MEEWKTIERPGIFGKKKQEILSQYDEKYSHGNWRIVWRWGKEGELIIPFQEACQIYEDGYYHDSFKREGLWKDLILTAKDVYDQDKSDVESGLDYLVQKGAATHLQDISIRRVVMRRGWKFEGEELVQIRSHSKYWGENLSPGKVTFHRPEMIIKPHICPKWCDDYSIECFYQDNKVLQIKS
ncbi:hypothetical protein GOV06_01690 [Candidatus Woesearchaeota archaeon]|nr:hypothetical protein [Candidatus Woesearchaeota archaeon]